MSTVSAEDITMDDGTNSTSTYVELDSDSSYNDDVGEDSILEDSVIDDEENNETTNDDLNPDTTNKEEENAELGKMDEEEAWKLIRDTASALAYLHAMNPPILHQDIKPANILLSDNGDYMLTDFGVSTQVKQSLSRVSNQEKDLLSGKKTGGICRYYVSDSTEGFSEMASLFLQREVGDLVEQIDIERY